MQTLLSYLCAKKCRRADRWLFSFIHTVALIILPSDIIGPMGEHNVTVVATTAVVVVVGQMTSSVAVPTSRRDGEIVMTVKET